MEETLIKFETAKLAKEKGLKFPLGISQNMLVYDLKGEEFSGRNISYQSDNYPAPTQSLLQKWLREVHDINITILICGADHHEYVLHDKNRRYVETVANSITHKNFKNNYEDTLEKALVAGLNLI